MDSGIWVHTLGDQDEVPASYQLSGQVERACVQSVAFLADSQPLISKYQDGVVKVWDRVTGNRVRVLGIQSESITEMAISTEGCMITYKNAIVRNFKK